MGIYSGNRGSILYKLVQDYFAPQKVLEPTRGDNLLDIDLSSQKEYVNNVNIM